MENEIFNWAIVLFTHSHSDEENAFEFKATENDATKHAQFLSNFHNHKVRLSKYNYGGNGRYFHPE